MTPKANNGTELLVENFSQVESARTQPKWLLPVRKAGIASFAEQGFPKLSDEDWRFTNVAPIAQAEFPARRPKPSSTARKPRCLTNPSSPRCPATGSCS